MAKKDFKDFVIVKNYAKIVKTYSYDKEHKAILTSFAFGDAPADTIFRFENKRTKVVEVNIDDIYKMYASNKYDSPQSFAEAVVQGYSLSITGDEEFTFIRSEVNDNRFDNTISNGLSTIEALFEIMKKVLGINVDNPLNEEMIETIYRDYLNKQKNLSIAIAGGAGGLGILIAIIIIVNGAGGLGGLLAAFSGVVGILAGIYFILRYVRFKKLLEKHSR